MRLFGSCLKKVIKPFLLLEGGIHSADDAIEKLEAGACLVQLTQVFYEGPALVKAINKKILAKVQ
jgi:dihydroorotate dehydrogenase